MISIAYTYIHKDSHGNFNHKIPIHASKFLININQTETTYVHVQNNIYESNIFMILVVQNK